MASDVTDGRATSLPREGERRASAPLTRLGVGLVERAQDLAVDLAIGCDDGGRGQVERPGAGARDGAAGLLDEERRRCDVPGPEAQLPEGLQPPGGDGGEGV